MDWEKFALPTVSTKKEDVRAYMDRIINPLSPRRRWVTQRAALHLWFYHGVQWIESASPLAPGLGPYNFREVQKASLAAYKRPVTNLIAPAVDNEFARLTKKEYEPEAAVSREHPEWIAAAQLARDIVTWDMSKQLWQEKRDALAFNLLIDETAILRTYWDENVNDLVPVGSTEAVVCPACQMVLASPQLPASMIETGIPVAEHGWLPFMAADSVEEADVVPGQPHRVRARTCPMCGAGELKEYDVSEEEATEGLDALGNPLGRMLPRGEDGVEVVSLHDFYPENGGLLEPHLCKAWHQKTARAIEDVVQRWPQFEQTIRPDDPQKILRLHPIYSHPGLMVQGLPFGLASGGMDTYENYVLVDEVVVAPQKRPGLELGAHFIRVNEEVISRPLCVKVDGDGGEEELVPRVRYHVARARRVPGVFWGRGPCSDAVPLNRRLNELDAQVIDLRERGKPMIWTPQQTELYFRSDSQGSLQVMEYEAPSTWTPKDGIFPGIAMTGNPYMEERGQILRDFQLVWGPQDIEMGRGAGGIKTTSGLMLAQEQAGERRGPLERGLVNIYEGAFQHVVDMQRTFRRGEESSYTVEISAGLFERKSWEGTQLVGSPKIRMKAKPGYDQALYDKEAAAEAVQMGLYKLGSPVEVHEALRLMRLPDNVNEDQKIQIKRAEMAWADFLREQKVPLIDEGLYDPTIWYPIFAKRWMDDESLVLQRKVDFESVMARLAGWEEALVQAEALDALQRQIYERQPPEKWQAVHREAQAKYIEAVGEARAAGLFPAQGPPPAGSGLEQPPPPPPNPDEGFLPKQREIRIFTVWERMLGPDLADAELAREVSERVGVEISPEAHAAQVLVLLLKMRAVIEALRQMLLGLAAPGPGAGPAGGAPPPAAPPQ